ncbi:hypothetical protein [uncultured Draconibacterium sp.]|uniref:hypothetical protein n=1 Tax=uncultured Draconibacterium sp. TaxID=1573823 RepID=UPI002AA7AEB6|nr:hypothetical protein [uncultured Draconibacterium sp.]
MGKVFLIAIILTNPLFIQAQYIKDKWGEVIPFSYTKKYKDSVRTDQIHSLVLPSFNNDSLFQHYNKGKTYEEVGSSFAVGFTIDSLVKFIDYAKKIEIDEGCLWLMTIESESAQSIGINIININFPDGVYFSVYPGTIPGLIEDPAVGFSKNINEWTSTRGFDARVNDKKMNVEFFVSKGVDYQPQIIIDKIIYGFSGFGRPGNKLDYEKMKEELEN